MSDATLTARWIFPASGPPLPRGTVTYADDKIVSVDPAGVRTADVDLDNAAIVPGLVNAHTHLDLTGARGQIPPTDPDHFCDWLRGVIAYRKTRMPDQVQSDIREGLSDCLRSGTTLIGDIASEGASWDALTAACTRAVVFREFIGLSPERGKRAYLDLLKWQNSKSPCPLTRTAVSPHAPYSVAAPYFRSTARRWPVAIHLAESSAEMQLIHAKTGPFESFLRELGIWMPEALIESTDRLLERTRRGPRALFVHCNYLDAATEFWPNQSVVYCPRTHAAFGHPPHPFREFLARGVRVCLGTDSLASNPDLDILAEARFVHEKYPDFPGDLLLKMITLTGAEALGWADEVGSLEAGKSADLVAVPLPDRDAADPYSLLFAPDARSTPRRTLFRGQWRT